MASSWYTHGHGLVIAQSANLTAAKVMLMRDTYTFAATHDHVSDINTYELSVTGYTGGYGGSGRHSLSSVTFTDDDTNNYTVMDAANPTVWSSLAAGQTIAAAVILIEAGGSDNTSHPIFYVDFIDVATGGDFSIDWAAAGIVRWKHAA